MLPDNIDDLFRDKLDGHETPPGDALWARLQATPAAEPSAQQALTNTTDERLDQLFQQRLSTHATPLARELWERLEDEHLRPRKRRAAAWWPMALAAAVALLLVAGGAGLWLGFPTLGTQSDTVASQPKLRPKAAGHKADSKANTNTFPTTGGGVANSPTLATTSSTQASKTPAIAPIQKNSTAQATRPSALASTASKANRATAGHSPRHPMGTTRQPDAATEQRPLVARTTPRQAPVLAPSPAADEQRPTTETNPAVAIAPKPVPTPEIVRTLPVPAPVLASSGEMITVDVRNGGSPAASRPAKIISTALAENEAPAERRGLGGRLLQQAGHLARGERVSLAEVTGLPENVTVRATLAGRSVSKSIRL